MRKVLRCVYCRRQDVPCSREHVIPEAFGRFENNLTLAPGDRPVVCAECNQFFGKTLDLALARDSWEALQRFHEGVREPDEMSKFFTSNIRVTFPEDSPLGPVRLRFVEPRSRASALGIEPVPQVCLARRSGGWTCLTETELEEAEPTADPDLRTEEVRILYSESDGDVAEERLVEILQRKGVPISDLHPWEDLPKGEGAFDAVVEGEVDRLLSRGLCKIAFNYLAWKVYQTDPGFPFRACFDPIRRFVREGTGPSVRTFMTASTQPILTQDGQRLRSTNGHLITLVWEKKPGGQILSKLSLFNNATYRIVLAHRPSGVWRDIGSGHHWNFVSGRVEPLRRASLIRPPPMFLLP